MILTSPSEDVQQTPPVTTTFDPPESNQVTSLAGRHRRGAIDWDRVERLHSFVKERALVRQREAERQCDDRAQREERRNADAIDAMLAQARRGHLLAACAITFFRARAMRDAHHPEFLGEWLGSATESSRSA
jgi:hypothetical protein